MSSKSTSFSVVFTVKDEWEFLRVAIPFYLSEGASKIFIFFDGTTDASLTKCSLFENVEARESVSISELSSIPPWVHDLQPTLNMDHRKRINTLFAIDRAQKIGIDWMFCIDPDEFYETYDNDILESLENIDKSIDQLILKNYEVLSLCSLGDESIFDQTYFLNRRNITAYITRIFRKLFKFFISNNNIERLIHLIYFYSNKMRYPRVALCPIDGSKLYFPHFLGYDTHKSVIRVSRAYLFLFNIHDWLCLSTSLKSKVLHGRLLHFYLPSHGHFIKKFQQLSPIFKYSGSVSRAALFDIARSDYHIAKKFYDNYICINKSRAKLLLESGIIFKSNKIKDFVSKNNIS